MPYLKPVWISTSHARGSTRGSQQPTMIGITSLLVVFVVLCLVTLSVLTLTYARSDYAFSQRLAQRRQAEFAAQNEAQAFLAELDRRLAEREAQGGKLDVSDLGGAVEGNVVFWETPIDDAQNLVLELKINIEGPDSYQINAWRVVSLGERAEATLPLLAPEGAQYEAE